MSEIDRGYYEAVLEERDQLRRELDESRQYAQFLRVEAENANKIASAAKFEIDRLVDLVRRLRGACFQAWYGFIVLRGQRPEDPSWTEPQRKAMKELDRLIEVTKRAKEES